MPHELVPAGRVLLDIVASLGIGACLLSLREGVATRQPVAARLRPRLASLTMALLALHLPVMLFVVAAARQVFGLPLQAQPGWGGAFAFAALVAIVCLCGLVFATAVAALRRALGGAFVWDWLHGGRLRPGRRALS
jgi:hypothetical protein